MRIEGRCRFGGGAGIQLPKKAEGDEEGCSLRVAEMLAYAPAKHKDTATGTCTQIGPASTYSHQCRVWASFRRRNRAASQPVSQLRQL